jgi:hypothetical protein
MPRPEMPKAFCWSIFFHFTHFSPADFPPLSTVRPCLAGLAASKLVCGTTLRIDLRLLFPCSATHLGLSTSAGQTTGKALCHIRTLVPSRSRVELCHPTAPADPINWSSLCEEHFREKNFPEKKDLKRKPSSCHSWQMCTRAHLPPSRHPAAGSVERTQKRRKK